MDIAIRTKYLLHDQRDQIMASIKTGLAQYYQWYGLVPGAGFVAQYNQLAPSETEKAESLEQLRVLANGFKVSLQAIDYDVGFGIDTEQDLQKARAFLAA